MTKSQNRRPRLDAIDVENLDHILQTSSYRIIEKRIRLVAEQKIAELVQPHTEIETATLRGFLAGLDLALRVPGILKSEASGKGGQQTDG